MSLADFEKPRFGWFKPDGGFEELPEAGSHKDRRYDTARWVGGAHDMQLLRAALHAARPEARAILDIASERKRQIKAEGWDSEHDDSHPDGALANAAACYAATDKIYWEARRVMHMPDEYSRGGGPSFTQHQVWPWEARWWKPKDRRRDLIRAAALIVAEIERLDRLAMNSERT